MYESIIDVINRGIPIEFADTDYTLSAIDNNTCIYMTYDQSTLTIPSDVGFIMGSKITIVTGYISNYIRLISEDTSTIIMANGLESDYAFGLYPNSLLTLFYVDINVWMVKGRVIPKNSITDFYDL